MSVSPFVLAMSLSLAGSLLGVLVASGIYLFGDEARERLVAWLVSYAVGSLLGLSLLHLVPEALETLPAQRALGQALTAVLIAYCINGFFLSQAYGVILYATLALVVGLHWTCPPPAARRR